MSLPSELTIYTVAELRARWLAWLSEAVRERATGGGSDSCLVDAASVAEVDGAGVQLLIALDRELGTAQWPLQLVNPSRALAQALDHLGLASTFASAATPGGAR